MMPRPHNESTLRLQEMVRLMKVAYNLPEDGVPEVFAELLVHSRSPLFHHLPDYVLKKLFKTQNKRASLQGPLDWIPVSVL